MLIPLVITSFMGSITEPIDFLFVFAAPALFVLHAIIAGTFMVILNVLGIRAGTNGLSSIILNIALGVEKTKWPLFLLLGVIQIFLYYFLFSYLIKKFNMKTPGREETVAATSNKVIETTSTKEEVIDVKDTKVNILEIVEALGGKNNITEVENCFTRLRVEVKDEKKINCKKLECTHNSGIVIKMILFKLIKNIGQF